MVGRMLAASTTLPNVWGEGALFGSSGLDGSTDSASGFVATLANRPYGLLLHTPLRRVFDIVLATRGTPRIVTGDVLQIETPAGPLMMTFCDWHTIIGVAPEGTKFRLACEEGDGARWVDPCWVSEDRTHGDVIAAAGCSGRFALAFGRTVEEACERAYAGLGADIEIEVAARLRRYQQLPTLPDPVRDRLLKKCLSVMAVNTLAPEGRFAQHWSTPDRVPHRDMWLWDTVFHSLAMNHVDARVAWECLQSVLETQDAEGMIPHQARPDGWQSDITQPPLLAWGVWENYQRLQDRTALADAFPRLERYLAWDCLHRDQNGNGLLEWAISGEPLCRSGESGMDNSPRFDAAATLDAVDFSVFAAQDMRCLADIAHELGHEENATAWRARADAVSATIHDLLWDEEMGLYLDRDMDGAFTGVKAVTAFLPLLLDDIPKERVERLLQWLQDPATFNAAFPVPSVALSEPSWSTDMWRGATWVNLNYLIILGLERQGKRQVAAWLAEKTIAHVGKYYARYGVTFEYYDADDCVPPIACDRKGPHQEPYNIRRKMDAVRDYHWTAALTACLLLR